MVALKRRELTKADEIRGKFEWNQDKCGERSFSDASVRNNQMPFFGMHLEDHVKWLQITQAQ